MIVKNIDFEIWAKHELTEVRPTEKGFFLPFSSPMLVLVRKLLIWGHGPIFIQLVFGGD